MAVGTDAGQVQAVARVRPAVLVAVSAWRLAIVGCAFVGFGEAARLSVSNAAYLTQQASLVTGVAYLGLLFYPVVTGGRRHEPDSGWLRGAVLVLLILVSGTYATLLAGTYHDLSGLLEHLVTPLLVAVDWLVVGRNQGATRWWHPVTWLGFPLAYLVFYLGYHATYGEALYHFLDPDSPSFVVMVPAFLISLLIVGYLVYGVAKLRRLIVSPTTTPHATGSQARP